jgi:hypothetical protein
MANTAWDYPAALEVIVDTRLEMGYSPVQPESTLFLSSTSFILGRRARISASYRKGLLLFSILRSIYRRKFLVSFVLCTCLFSLAFLFIYIFVLVILPCYFIQRS